MANSKPRRPSVALPIFLGMVIAAFCFTAVAALGYVQFTDPRGKKTEDSLSALFEQKAQEAKLEGMDPRAAAVWRESFSVLYGDLAAFGVDFELSSDPLENCAVDLGSKGGCFHNTGPDENMIFISPDMELSAVEWVIHHEYAHYEQKWAGTRYIADQECDADLRTFARLKSWNLYFRGYCETAGLTEEQMEYSNLPLLAESHRAEREAIG